jgi:hypothetical protein
MSGIDPSSQTIEELTNLKLKPKKEVMIPTKNGPVPYGTYEAAEALAPIWGIHPDKVHRIMMVETGQLHPDHAFVIDQIQEDQEAKDIKQWGGFERPDLYEQKQ